MKHSLSKVIFFIFWGGGHLLNCICHHLPSLNLFSEGTTGSEVDNCLDV